MRIATSAHSRPLTRWTTRTLSGAPPSRVQYRPMAVRLSSVVERSPKATRRRCPCASPPPSFALSGPSSVLQGAPKVAEARRRQRPQQQPRVLVHGRGIRRRSMRMWQRTPRRR